MPNWNLKEHLALGAFTLRWTLLAAPMAAAVGTACALFLWSLELATLYRESHPALLFGLPAAGIAIVATYQAIGGKSAAGNNLLIDEIHEPGAGVPRRMGLLVLVATVITHLFGGSAGREGTAVQMGGSIAAACGRWFKLGAADLRMLLMCGIAAGFAGVFGTPLTGAVFAMEVLTLGRISYEAIIPCLIAALVGDWSCAAWGTHHTHYSINPDLVPSLGGATPYNGLLMIKVALAAVAFGLTSTLFSQTMHGLTKIWQRIRPPLLRPVAGALVVIGLVYALGTRDYLGIGVSSPDPGAVTILSSFHAGGAGDFSWWWKLLFTAITLSCGFKGGEVTPLFFIGAALGNSLAKLLHAPVDLFAGLGFIAVFAGATNTPLACTIMGVELFGGHYTVYFMIACFLAYGFSGHNGIYHAQRLGTPKLPNFVEPEG